MGEDREVIERVGSLGLTVYDGVGFAYSEGGERCGLVLYCGEVACGEYVFPSIEKARELGAAILSWVNN